MLATVNSPLVTFLMVVMQQEWGCMDHSTEGNQGNGSARKKIHGSGGSEEENILRVSGTDCQGFQPRGLRQIEHEIHILDYLTCPSLYEVVNAAKVFRATAKLSF